MGKWVAYADLVACFVAPNSAAMMGLRSNNQNASIIRGFWSEILAVFDRQEIYLPTEHPTFDLRSPIYVVEETVAMPGWGELRAFLAAPGLDEDGRIETLLRRIWRNDATTMTRQLAHLSYGLRMLTRARSYEIRLNDPIYEFLRLAIARPVDWDYLTDLNVGAWEPFCSSAVTYTHTPAYLTLHRMRPLLGRLDVMLNQLVAANQLDQAYSLTLRGLTALFFLHHCAAFERYSSGLHKEEQAMVAGVAQSLWKLTMGLIRA